MGERVTVAWPGEGLWPLHSEDQFVVAIGAPRREQEPPAWVAFWVPQVTVGGTHALVPGRERWTVPWVGSQDPAGRAETSKLLTW